MGFSSLMAKVDTLLIATFGAEGGVTLWPDGITPRRIMAIFDAPYERTDVPDGGHITGSDISFTARDCDILNLQRKEAVWVDGSTYYVKELQPDGLGMTRVMLSAYKKSPPEAGGRL